VDAGTLERLVIAAGLIALGWGAYWAWSRVQLKRLAGARAAQVRGLEGSRPGVPAVLYFTTPDCAVCKAAQRPALQRLQERLGEAVQVIEVDACEQPGVADYWGVLSVPTTFIVDAQGRPRTVNHGLASAEKLQRQVEAVRGRMTDDGRPAAFAWGRQTKDDPPRSHGAGGRRTTRRVGRSQMTTGDD
jgi:thioredoxin 1